MASVFSKIFVTACLLLLLMLSEAHSSPNFLIITSDDQRTDQVDPYMPNVRERIFDKGLEFSRAYITTPVCCPSRASILTGLYAGNHSVRNNYLSLDEETLFEILQEDYFTGLIGKYLNSWDGSPRSEFDYWVAFRGKGSPFVDPIFNYRGKLQEFSGHIHEWYTTFALEFLEEAQESGKSFALMLNYNTPHLPAVPEEQDRGRFDDIAPPFYEKPNFEKVFKGKPQWVREFESLPQPARYQTDLDTWHQRVECIYGMDRSIGEVLDALEARGFLEDTLIFFISDNGYFFGEHTLHGKTAVYEEAAKVPFGLRWDSGNIEGRTSAALVANTDIAPTILELANKRQGRRQDGKSLVPLFSKEVKLRPFLFLQVFAGSSSYRRPHAAIHNGEFVLIQNENDRAGYDIELYDLTEDPYQLMNLAREKEYRRIRRRGLRILRRYVKRQ